MSAESTGGLVIQQADKRTKMANDKCAYLILKLKGCSAHLAHAGAYQMLNRICDYYHNQNAYILVRLQFVASTVNPVDAIFEGSAATRLPGECPKSGRR